jgi:DNA adenine methylase
MSSINSPFRYAGGKFYARNLILPRIPKHSFYCEPLAGGASIFFAKEKVESNWLNDIDEELINCFIHIRDRPEELADFLEGKKPSRELHLYYKNEFKPKNDLERAGRWYLLNRISYSGIMKVGNCFWGYGDKYSMQPKNWRRHLLRCSRKLQNVRITCRDFEGVVDEVPDCAFLFVDPPYFNRDQDKFYNYIFSLDDHKRLVEVLKRNSGRIKFLLTYDDSEEVRNMYSWANETLNQEWTYTINRTDDQTGKTNNKGKRRKGKEIFILNYNTLQAKITAVH